MKATEQALLPDLRYLRAMDLTAHLMRALDESLRSYDEDRLPQRVQEEVFKALYEAGVEVITDADREKAGLPARNEKGLTLQEIQVQPR